MSKPKKDQVFVSYAHKNLETVKKIVIGLKKRKLNVWFDKEHLGPGRWKTQIIKAINRSRYFVICISEAALRQTGDEKPGFQDNELQTAYDTAQAQPDHKFTIVPVRLEECEAGDFRITSFQEYDLFPDFEGGLDRLAVDLGGISLSDANAEDKRTEDEMIIYAHSGKAIAALYANDNEKVLTILNNIKKLEGRKDIFEPLKGIALTRLGRHEEALEAYDKALEIYPDLAFDVASVWSLKGSVLEKLGRHEEALEAINKVLEFNPYDQRAWIKRACVLTHEYKLKRFANPPIKEVLGIEEVKDGAFVIESNLEEKKLQRYKSYGEEALSSSHKSEKARIKGVDGYKGPVATKVKNRSKRLQRYRRYREEALFAINRAIELKPDDFFSWSMASFIFLICGTKQETLSAIDRAIELKPDDYSLWKKKAILHERFGTKVESLYAHDKAIELKPDDLDALNVWTLEGVELMEIDSCRRHEEQIDFYDTLLEWHPDDAKSWYEKGLRLHKLCRYEEALESYDKALEIDPDNTNVWYFKSASLVKLGCDKVALRAINQALEINPDFEYALLLKNKLLLHDFRLNII